ncbi:hypothetical protein DNI29_08590 [Hymenobacter sediminis]|uniref:hypothetical protein n=1 Tax=Hymenobacter sediminis TaxID=2218621 RepID=UPI000DA6918D|nr:hypothetical protein [Hymenobacter sediminis]RPD48661.1 hypothetical protein DNI29_08590 [Hymenobacter sediminis]
MKKKTVITIQITAMALFIFLLILYIANVSAPRVARYQKKSIIGRVTDVTDQNRNTVHVKINNVYLFLKLPGDSYKYLSPGDFIEKKANGQDLTIYKDSGDYINKIDWVYVRENGYIQIKKTKTLINK